MSGALPQQPEEFLDHLRHVPHDHVPTVEEELDEYLLLREVKVEKLLESLLHQFPSVLTRIIPHLIGGSDECPHHDRIMAGFTDPRALSYWPAGARNALRSSVWSRCLLVPACACLFACANLTFSGSSLSLQRFHLALEQARCPASFLPEMKTRRGL